MQPRLSLPGAEPRPLEPLNLALILLKGTETSSIRMYYFVDRRYVIGRCDLARASRRHMRHNKLPESEQAAARVGLTPDGDARGRVYFI